jgi:hypothetical protein
MRFESPTPVISSVIPLWIWYANEPTIPFANVYWNTDAIFKSWMGSAAVRLFITRLGPAVPFADPLSKNPSWQLILLNSLLKINMDRNLWNMYDEWICIRIGLNFCKKWRIAFGLVTARPHNKDTYPRTKAARRKLVRS